METLSEIWCAVRSKQVIEHQRGSSSHLNLERLQSRKQLQKRTKFAVILSECLQLQYWIWCSLLRCLQMLNKTETECIGSIIQYWGAYGVFTKSSGEQIAFVRHQIICSWSTISSASLALPCSSLSRKRRDVNINVVKCTCKGPLIFVGM